MQRSSKFIVVKQWGVVGVGGLFIGDVNWVGIEQGVVWVGWGCDFVCCVRVGLSCVFFVFQMIFCIFVKYIQNKRCLFKEKYLLII